MKSYNVRKYLWILLLISFAVRAIVAGLTELGNDEVYYRLYALFPDLSHFDHPPMVGWVIQLFSLNLLLKHEFFIRLGAVILGTVNTWLIFRIGKEIKDEITGWYAALLYTASIYCSVIAGTFIIPDSPQLFFWLLTLLFLWRSLPDHELKPESRRNLLFAGITVGLALLSKYHSVFLVTGAGIYILFFNRRWFGTKELYLALLAAIVLFLPVIIWNFQNDFISFTFHEERVERTGIRWDFLGTELGGQLFYNNPVNVLLILVSLFALIRRNYFIRKNAAALLLAISLPLSVVFLSFSIGNRTLPHWTGPAYLGYMLIAATWLSGQHRKDRIRRVIPVILQFSLGLILFLVIIASLQISFGVIPLYKLKIQDPTTQLYGYRQLGKKFQKISSDAEQKGQMPPHAPVIATRWFPAANLDYYVSEPTGRRTFALGALERIHKYYWINQEQGGIPKGTSAWYIGLSDDLPRPSSELVSRFDSVRLTDSLQITRGKQVVREAYVYRLYGYDVARLQTRD